MNCKSKLVKPWDDLRYRSIIGTPKLAGKLPENDLFINESFLRDQIAGMKKIDKLVEEAEQSITKVVQRFDKFLIEPTINTESSMDSDVKRKDLKFDIDDSCDCPQKLRCDCDPKTPDQLNFISRPESPAVSEPLTPEPFSDHLNTISERTESVPGSQGSIVDASSVLSDTPNPNVPLRARNIKKNAKISIDTRNIVQIPPTIESVPAALREAGTETEDVKKSTKSKPLEIQNMPAIEIRPPFVVQKIYNINIEPSSNKTDPTNVPNKKNSHYVEMKYDDPIIVEMVDSQGIPYADIKDKEPLQIDVIKAPVSAVRNPESITQTPNRKMCKNARQYMNKSTNSERIVNELFDNIRDFQIPMISTRSVDANCSISTDSDYVVVQDGSTQVSASNISKNDQFQTPAPLISSMRTRDGPTQKSKGVETFVPTLDHSTATSFPTNMRPPIPFLPMVTHKPSPYDKEEVAEIELFSNSLDYSDVIPIDLSKNTDSKMAEAESKPYATDLQDASNLAQGKSLEKTKPTDTIVLKQIDNENVDDKHFMLAAISSGPINTVVLVEKPDSVSDLNDYICLANAYDFNASCEDEASNAGINISCSRPSTPGDQMATNKTANDYQKSIELIGYKVKLKQCSDKFGDFDKSNVPPNIQSSTNKPLVTDELKTRDPLTTSQFEEPMASAIKDIQETLDQNAPDTSNLADYGEGQIVEPTNESLQPKNLYYAPYPNQEPPTDIEGNQIMEATNEYPQQQNLYQNREPLRGPTNQSPIAIPNLTRTVDIEGVQITEPIYESVQQQNLYQNRPPNQTQSAMRPVVRFDQLGVNTNLRPNLLLDQLQDDGSFVSYHKRPVVRTDSFSSASSSNSSGDYPKRNKYLMRAKRRPLSGQRGIITEDPDDFILHHSPDRYDDTLSDGELSHYTTSSGEMLPIGPRLLRNRNFMRRRPDRIFQMELNQRNLHIQRQHNHFNNWVSYYVTDNTKL